MWDTVSIKFPAQTLYWAIEAFRGGANDEEDEGDIAIDNLVYRSQTSCGKMVRCHDNASLVQAHACRQHGA